jgi:hypothetical protein
MLFAKRSGLAEFEESFPSRVGCSQPAPPRVVDQQREVRDQLIVEFPIEPVLADERPRRDHSRRTTEIMFHPSVNHASSPSPASLFRPPWCWSKPHGGTPVGLHMNHSPAHVGFKR